MLFAAIISKQDILQNVNFFPSYKYLLFLSQRYVLLTVTTATDLC